MRTRRPAHHHAVVSALAMMLGITGAMASGCGSNESIVGGECVSGYSRCGGTCCPSAMDGSAGNQLEGGSGDGPSDGGNGGDGAQRANGDSGVVTGDDSGSGSGSGGRSGSGSGSGGASGSGSGGASGSGSGGASGSGSGGASGSGSGSVGDDSGAGDDASGDDASGDDASGISCPPPLIDCGGVCVDLTNDSLNCGACGVQCPSQICQDSMCVGSTVGGVVFIGHDFALDPASPGPAQVLSNSLFMSRSNPLHVMSYERYAQPVAVLSVDAVMLGTAGLLGRQVSLTSTVTDADIPARLMADSYDVLVVHDQTSASPGAMATLGASWSSVLTSFTLHYGIVIILDGGTGMGEMPQFSTATGLLQVGVQSPLSAGSPLQVLAPGDAVGIGVVSPYAASSSSVFVTTEPNGGNVAYVVGGMGPGQGPVVIHKVF